jgi:hypothetical protein
MIPIRIKALQNIIRNTPHCRIHLQPIIQRLILALIKPPDLLTLLTLEKFIGFPVFFELVPVDGVDEFIFDVFAALVFFFAVVEGALLGVVAKLEIRRFGLGSRRDVAVFAGVVHVAIAVGVAIDVAIGASIAHPAIALIL